MRKRNALKTKLCSLSICLAMAAAAFIPGMSARAEALPAAAVRIYTGEPITAAQAAGRPIAVMMPTDKIAQPSYGIGNAKILYEIMEEGEISRQMAIIDDWQGLAKIGNIRSCRLYYIPEAMEWDPILVHFGGVVYMKDKITAPDVDNLSGTSEYGVGGAAPGSVYFFRTTDRKAPHKLAENVVDELSVSTPSVETPVRRLSGGNVQKVLVGREIASAPTVLLTAYAVRGLDINSSYTIYDLINKEKKQGVAVIYVGEDLDVLLELSDKILVLCGGRVSGYIEGRGADKRKVGMMMTKLGGAAEDEE